MTFKEFKDKSGKGVKEDAYLRYIVRPISVRLAYPLRNIKADYITILSIPIAAFGGISMGMGMPLLGAIVINLYLLIDCVDGTIARFVGSTDFGRYLDSTGADFGYISIFSGAGIVAYRFFGNEIFIILGFIAALAKIMERYLRSKYVRFVVMRKMQGGKTQQVKKNTSSRNLSPSKFSLVHRKFYGLWLYPLLLSVAIIGYVFGYTILWKAFVIWYGLTMPLIAFISILHFIRVKKVHSS